MKKENISNVGFKVPENAKIERLDPNTLLVSRNRWAEKKEDTEFGELVQSLRTNGQSQPVPYYKSDNGTLHLVTGHRRRRACIEAGIPILAYEVPKMLEEERMMIDAKSNIEVASLTPMDKAQAMQRFKEDFKWTGKKIADFYHITPGAVSQYLKLLLLHPNLQECCDMKKKNGNGYVVGMMEAYGLSKLSTSEQIQYAAQAMEANERGEDMGSFEPVTIESGIGTNIGNLPPSGGEGGSGDTSTRSQTKAYGIRPLLDCIDAVLESNKMPVQFNNALDCVRKCISKKMIPRQFASSLKGIDLSKKFTFKTYEEAYPRKGKKPVKKDDSAK